MFEKQENIENKIEPWVENPLQKSSVRSLGHGGVLLSKLLSKVPSCSISEFLFTAVSAILFSCGYRVGFA